MSYDFAIQEKTGKPPCCGECGRSLRHQAYWGLGSPTYNVGNLFRRMGGRDDFQSSVHWTLEEAREFFANCLETYDKMATDHALKAELRAMEPENGWGSIGTVSVSARKVIEAIDEVLKEGGLRTSDKEDYNHYGDDQSLGYEWDKGPESILIPVEDLEFTS